METIIYVLNSLGWSAVGFGVGYYVSALRREVRELRDEISEQNRHGEDPPH